MPNINLKNYTSLLKDLEIAIYTQERLTKSHENIIKKQYPSPPKRAKLKSAPEKPQEINEKVKLINKNEIFLWILAVIFIALGLVGIICLFSWNHFDNHLPIFICLGFGVLGVGGIIGIYQDYKERLSFIELRKKRYKEDIENYPKMLTEYNKQIEIEALKHQEAMNKYRADVSKYNQEYNETIEKHNSALKDLKNALDNLYNENIIFPKYRNLVAITAINEYLLSGRCDKLEGSDGAYNLYEMELRQNIIIGQLSNIVDNLEQIKSNQFTLYQELQKSNNIIDEILSEIQQVNDTTKLTAYFTRVTALAETSPKYYHGLVM